MTDSAAVSASPVNAPEKTPARAGRRRHRRGADAPARAGAAEASRPEDRLSIRLLQAVDVCFSRIYHRVNVLAPQRLPKQGPAILICNHTSGLDPMLIQSVCPRLIVWMMAKEYYEIRALRWVFKTVEAIPVDRGGRDLAATRSALRALEAGRILGVFPEGKIETSRELLPFQTGVAMMAVKASVPVYPAYLDGTQRGKEMVRAVALPNRATLRFGPPVEFDRSGTAKPQLEEATAKIQAAVEALRRQAVSF